MLRYIIHWMSGDGAWKLFAVHWIDSLDSEESLWKSCGSSAVIPTLKKKLKLFIFRVRGGEGKREGEKHQLGAYYSPPTGDLAYNPGICSY